MLLLCGACLPSCRSLEYFDLSLTSSSGPIGCLSVQLSLPSADCLADNATISLLLPRRSGRSQEEGEEEGEGEEEEEEGKGSKRSIQKWLSRQRRERQTEEAELLCGPTPLKPLMDITGCSVQVRGHRGQSSHEFWSTWVEVVGHIN